MDSYDILVIILSVALAIFLALSIWALVYIIQVMKTVRRIADKADHVVDNIETASEFLKKSASQAAIGGFVSKVVDAFKKRGKD